MTEPTQAVNPTSFNYSVDQQVSVNAFIDIDVNGEPVKFQITSRYNSTPEKIVKTTKAAIEAFAAIRAEYQRPEKPVQAIRDSSASEPKSEHKNENAGTYEDPRWFHATSVVVSMTDGKQYFKVKGEDGKFPKFPVTIWPETLEKFGIDPNAIDMKNGHALTDVYAFYIINEKGNPAKVIRLENSPF